MKPVVSIITPAFNSSKLIGQAIRSVQLQTFKNWEMIIVDDCSTDDTPAVVTRYAAEDSRIRLICRSENGGPARARNAALKSAKGRYIAFLDSDDLWLSKKLELQLAFMAEQNSAFSYTLYRRFTDDSAQPGRLVSLSQSFDYRSLLKNTGIGCLTVMVDCELTGPIEMPLVRAEDYALWLGLVKRGFIAHGLQVDLARYRVAEGSVSGNKLKSASWVWFIYRNVEKLSISDAAWCFLNYVWKVLIRRMA
jgi:teichuronic acid biosynthesis glycosyltransferase TuaG